MTKSTTQRDSWQELLDFLPYNWLQLAHEHDALKGLKKDKSPDSLLRTILLHCACGYSLRETVVRAKEAGLADMSDVALLKRMKKCSSWLCAMCAALLSERGITAENSKGLRFRVFDATHVKEPGKTGSQWRLHYSICLPDLNCDSFVLSEAKGKGNGESLCRFPVNEGDCILADRIYCRGGGLEYAAAQGAFITVRLQPEAVVILDKDKNRFNLLDALKEITETGQVGEWDVYVGGATSKPVAGRICAMLKTEESRAASEKKSIDKAKKNCSVVRESTLFYSRYIIVFSTLDNEHSAMDILNYYRLRWQVELVFKRFKQIAGLGHLPKYDDVSSKAWLYGKLFAALLTEKLLAYGSAISPWGVGYGSKPWNGEAAHSESLEGICLYVSPSDINTPAISQLERSSFKVG